MKVLDLQCAFAHTFEGWFASEQDFVAQCAQSLIQCPVCGDPFISKKLSAPRLNLMAKRAQPIEPSASATPPASSLPATSAAHSSQPTDVALAPKHDAALMNAWMEMARRVVANTTDVGDQFAEEARKMHYGEAQERSIRGKATAQETRELMEEGIAVLPLMLPESFKGPLQ
jgi:hypothetical protein